MFPNVRLIVAAVLASIAALSCGFGIFATVRVNHDPLARLPAGATPFQLVAENMVPPAATFAAIPRTDSRSPLNQAIIAGTLAIKQESGAVVGPQHDIALVDQIADPKPDQDVPAPPAALAATPVTPVAAEPIDTTTVVAAAPADTADQIAKTDTPPAAPASAPPDATPVQTAPAQEAAQEPKLEDTTATVSPPGDAHRAETAAPKIHAVERKIVRKRAHVRVARAAGQADTQSAPFGASQQYPMPTQTTQYIPFGEQPAKPEKRRLVLKITSRRAAKPGAKASPASQSAVGGPFVPAPAQ